MMKGIYLDILKSGREASYTISDVKSRVFFPCETGHAELKAGDYVVEIHSVVAGKEHFFLSPIPECQVEYMEQGSYSASGNFAYSSDSRFPFEYPLCIHDHFTYY